MKIIIEETAFPMGNYKSWKGLKKQLEERLCDKLKGRIEYYYTVYRKGHSSPFDDASQAKILLDKNELLSFDFLPKVSYKGEDGEPFPLHEDWDFLLVVTNFLNMNISVALHGNYDTEKLKVFQPHIHNRGVKIENIYDYIETQGLIDLVKLFAIIDKRVGKRTLIKLIETKEYENYPKWLMPIFELRCEVEGIQCTKT